MKPNSLAIRIGSAAILIPIVIGVVWFGLWTVAITLAVMIILSLLELYGAFRHNGYQPQTIFGIVFAIAILLSGIADQLNHSELTNLTYAVGVMGSLIIALIHHDRKGLLADWALTLAGALYMGVLSTHIALIRLIDTPLHPGALPNLGISSGAAWLYLVCTVTWLQDALAYFAGKSYGRHKMSPVLSPKKTWEGAAGGMLGAILGGVLAILICGLATPWWVGVILGIVGGIIGPLGDLAESMIKRQAGIKDAGHLIPGHGGLLDRIDSFLFTSPTLYYLILLIQLWNPS